MKTKKIEIQLVSKGLPTFLNGTARTMWGDNSIRKTLYKGTIEFVEVLSDGTSGENAKIQYVCQEIIGTPVELSTLPSDVKKDVYSAKINSSLTAVVYVW